MRTATNIDRIHGWLTFPPLTIRIRSCTKFNWGKGHQLTSALSIPQKHGAQIVFHRRQLV
ncbi:hypothetical protein BC777_2834 [Yoonia maricola]|uniref:Uncharacterized protein n=1 Tax=Yoonia maricola TaxID=420999 RepID=A0A2M8W6B0_9RHOB|nr:hypothetical protein BC777_2834 [Yoonia maricola]